ncbi:hypothetical protein PAPYR_4771 [Paratrimastix pyriformis]|uniref:Uncharacterized protein n=1 Tax=Paratrimastix pyriformis TaxID=342808 RepID=A0ABQ8UJ48_9EUKA|nr:hypothetical protein PAPYR_4771 [Paratrimastix pyriformis]
MEHFFFIIPGVWGCWSRYVFGAPCVGNEAAPTELSDELGLALARLRQTLLILAKTLVPGLQPSIWAALADQIDFTLLQQVLVVHRFSTQGALQFDLDCKFLFALWRPHTSVPENYFKRSVVGMG